MDSSSRHDPQKKEHNLDRDYKFFQAETGLADTSPTESKAEFTVKADGVIKQVMVVSFGEKKPIRADISYALRITLPTNAATRAVLRRAPKSADRASSGSWP